MSKLSDLTAQCIRCGFCVESCPTFLLTGVEAESPRGRIRLVRDAEEGKIGWNDDVRTHIERCLGCLACQTACPSGVRYGEILELARDRFEKERPRKIVRKFVDGLASPGALEAQLALGALWPGKRIPSLVSRALSGQSAEAELPKPLAPEPWPPMAESELPPVRGEVHLLEGCAMRVLFPGVHEATRRLLRRVGLVVRTETSGCCGALHAHIGMLDDARERAERLGKDFDDDLPIVVNAAGCGSTLRGYEELFGENLQSVARRAVDASRLLYLEGLLEPLAKSPGLPLVATYHDACHLAHGQGVRVEPRALLGAIPRLRLVPLEESEVCCGSAGVYNILQPNYARSLLERKWANIQKTGCQVVALGNPGCHAWIAQAGREKSSPIVVHHTLELLEASFSGLREPLPSA